MNLVQPGDLTDAESARLEIFDAGALEVDGVTTTTAYRAGGFS